MYGSLMFVNTFLCLCLITVAGCAIVSTRVQTRLRKGQQRVIDAYKRQIDAQSTLIVSLQELLLEKDRTLAEQAKQLKMYRAPPFHGEPMDENTVDAAGNKLFTPSKCGMVGFFGHRLESDDNGGIALNSAEPK